MNHFLKDCFKLKNLANICYVLGNESCDLDSAVCAIALAYYYQHNRSKICNKKPYDAFIPILNVARANFPIKTEVRYYFKQNRIDFENICFIDEIKESALRSSDIILVDHHFSPFRDSVIQVIDHHQFDDGSGLRPDCDTTINLVGSCSSLVADLCLKSESDVLNEAVRLLYGPIILDTVNFSKEADKARQLDVDVCEQIEAKFGISQNDRNELFVNLVEARAAIDGLNAYQILFKDMKLVSNRAKTFNVAIPGYPMLVYDYIKMANAEKCVQDFARDQDCAVVVLMGMQIKDDSVGRDLGIININNQILFDKIVTAIENFQNPNLLVQRYDNCNFLNGIFFKQNNVKASRKQILPLVKSVMEEIK